LGIEGLEKSEIPLSPSRLWELVEKARKSQGLDWNTVADYLRLIDHHTGGSRSDVTPLFADYEAFWELIRDIGAHFKQESFDVVAGIDALGFILGTALALHNGKGLITIRKGGKLSEKADKIFFVDYSKQEKSLELRHGAITPGTRVLIVDEWIETGAQVNAAVDLVTRQGGIVAGIATISMDENEATRTLRENYYCYAASQDG
jgi:adenine phosphoribosyltransferase